MIYNDDDSSDVYEDSAISETSDSSQKNHYISTSRGNNVPFATTKQRPNSPNSDTKNMRTQVSFGNISYISYKSRVSLSPSSSEDSIRIKNKTQNGVSVRKSKNVKLPELPNVRRRQNYNLPQIKRMMMKRDEWPKWDDLLLVMMSRHYKSGHGNEFLKRESQTFGWHQKPSDVPRVRMSFSPGITDEFPYINHLPPIVPAKIEKTSRLRNERNSKPTLRSMSKSKSKNSKIRSEPKSSKTKSSPKESKVKFENVKSEPTRKGSKSKTENPKSELSSKHKSSKVIPKDDDRGSRSRSESKTKKSVGDDDDDDAYDDDDDDDDDDNDEDDDDDDDEDTQDEENSDKNDD